MGKTILLADDDENDVLLLKMAFAKAGLLDQVQTVRNGAEAIAYLSGQGIYAERERYPFPALLLLDLKMPYKNGFEVLRWARSRPATRRLIVTVLTASRNSTDISNAYDLGTNSYLVKPTPAEEMENLARLIKEYWLETNVNPLCPHHTP